MSQQRKGTVKQIEEAGVESLRALLSPLLGLMDTTSVIDLLLRVPSVSSFRAAP